MPIGHFAHTHFPYLIQQTSDGKWLALNRKYKPLGTTSDEWVDYDTHPGRIAIDHRSLAAIRRVAVNEQGDAGGRDQAIFFYNDGFSLTDSDSDWTRYAKILKVLARASVK